jgi:hypothetical protein
MLNLGFKEENFVIYTTIDLVTVHELMVINKDIVHFTFTCKEENFDMAMLQCLFFDENVEFVHVGLAEFKDILGLKKAIRCIIKK